jgi:hypothetical protein
LPVPANNNNISILSTRLYNIVPLELLIGI